MRIVRKGINATLKIFGNIKQKQKIWNEEFKKGKWDNLINTESDPIYEYLNIYANDGMILDLGCGSGNTGCEIKIDRYREYVGVDISNEAINIAKNRIMNDHQRNGRIKYHVSDIITYIPDNNYDVILFRESIYYIKKTKIKNTIDRYRMYLNKNGVIIIRLCNRQKYKNIINMIIENYNIIDKDIKDDNTTAVMVFN